MDYFNNKEQYEKTITLEAEEIYRAVVHLRTLLKGRTIDNVTLMDKIKAKNEKGGHVYIFDMALYGLLKELNSMRITSITANYEYCVANNVGFGMNTSYRKKEERNES